MQGTESLFDDLQFRLMQVEDKVARLEADRGGGAAPDSAVSMADIRAAYRLLLHREADEGGLAHYRDRVASGSFTHADLMASMADSDEYNMANARRLTTVDVAGVQVSIDPDEPEFGRTIARDGIWEPHIVACIRDNLSPGDTFVDIGANVGIMSFHAAAVVGRTGRVLAFEPNQDNVQRFLQGVLLNGFENVALFPFAASDKPSIFSIRGHSNTYLIEASIGGRLTQSFPADQILRGAARIDFIKIDIEGHEPHAIAGLAETLRRHRPKILCEFNPRCLRDNLGLDMALFAERIFELTNEVEIVEHDSTRTHVGGAQALIATWRERDADLAQAGELASGMLHFDLLFQVR